MSLALRISIIVTSVLVATLVVAWLLLMWLYKVGNHGSYQIVLYFWVLPTIFVTVPSLLITLGILLGKRNRNDQDDQSLRL